MSQQAAFAVEFDGVSKRFGTTMAVDGISFQVRRGEVVSLLGPSGCGKSTMLRLIAGFESPDAGQLRLFGRNVVGIPAYERNVGLLFQDYALFPHMTVEQNVTYGMRRRKVPSAAIPERLARMLHLVQLNGLEKRRPASLSGGQQQRVALARALATGPELLLLDEPLSALDAKLRQELQTQLKDILTSVGTTAIVVTHDQEEAMSLTERIFVMNRGRIMQEGTPTEIYASPVNRFVAEFIGRSNWFPGKLLGSTGGPFWTFGTEAGFELVVTAPPDRQNGDIEVSVRPERIEILRQEAPRTGDPAVNVVPGRIVRVLHLGGDLRVLVAIGEGLQVTVLEKFAGTIPYRAGDEVALTIRAKDCLAVSGRSSP